MATPIVVDCYSDDEPESPDTAAEAVDGAETATETVLLELTIDRNLAPCTDAEQRALLGAVARLLNGDEVKVLRKRSGGSTLTLELTPVQAARLLPAAQAGHLRRYHVTHAVLIENNSPQEPERPAPGPSRSSLSEVGEEEALRFRWIESEKAGRDLGDAAIREWIRQHWNGFLRKRRLEHLQGKTYWIELDHHDFGLLQRVFQGSPLIEPIIDQFAMGHANLDIILWAMKHEAPLNEVMAILQALDINSLALPESRDPDF